MVIIDSRFYINGCKCSSLKAEKMGAGLAAIGAGIGIGLIIWELPIVTPEVAGEIRGQTLF